MLWTLEDTQIERQIDSFTTDKVDPAGLRYLKRRWAENRRDHHDGYGHSWWYLEIDSALNVIRQTERYDHGLILGYRCRKPQVEFGMLSTEPLNSSLDAFESTSLAEFNDLWERRLNM